MRLALKLIAAVCAALMTVAAVGCSGPATPVDVASSRSAALDAYLSNDVQPGWTRSVGTTESLALVLESAKTAATGEDLRYRLALFNTGERDVAWDDVFFIVRFRRADGTGGFGLRGAMPVGAPGNNIDPPSLTLRSGESTTHEGVLSGGTNPDGLPYVSLLQGTFATGSRGERRLVSTPEIEAVVE